MDTLIGAFCAVSGKDHPDRAEFRGAMVSDHRRADQRDWCDRSGLALKSFVEPARRRLP
jgi:hypothetical protein